MTSKGLVKVYERWPGDREWGLRDVFSSWEEARSYMEHRLLPYDTLIRIVSPKGTTRYFSRSPGGLESVPKKFLQGYIELADNGAFLRTAFTGTGLAYGFHGSKVDNDKVERLRSGLTVDWNFIDGVGKVEMTLSQAKAWAEAGGMNEPTPYKTFDVSGRLSGEDMDRVDSLSHLGNVITQKGSEVYEEEMGEYREKSLKLLEDVKE